MSVAQVASTLATRLALVAAGLVTSVITARYLGPDGRGQFFFWTTVAALVVQFGNAGLQASNAYLLTRRGADAGVLGANSLLVSLVAGLSLGGAALAVLAWGDPGRQVGAVRVAAVLMLSVSGLYAMLGANLLVALGRVGEFNRVELVMRYGPVVVMLAAAWAWCQVDSLLLALGLASLASCGFVLWRLQQVAPLGRPSATVLREGMGYGLRAYLAAGLGMLVARSNAFLLAPRVDATEYGTWSIAMQCFDVMNLIPASVALVLLPRILRAERPHHLLGPQMLLVGGLLTVVTAGFVLVGAPVIQLLYGAAFVPAYHHLLWGLPGLLALGVTAILSQYLAARGLPWSLVWLWLVVALLQGALAWILIPAHGADGAMLSLSVAYVVGMGLIAALVRNVRGREARSPMSQPLALTAYPLSAAFERRVQETLGKPTQAVTIAQLRAQGMGGLARRLWQMRGDPIALPIEEDNGAALLPVLKLLAACTRSRSICVIRPDLSREPVSRWRIAWDGVRFAGASLACLWAAGRARRELAGLLARPRHAVPRPPDGAAVLYLKTNLWFGIKAGGSVGHIAGIVNGLQRGGHPVTFASAEPPVMIDEGVSLLEVKPPKAFGLPYELNNYRFQQGFDRALESRGAPARAGLIYQRLSAANYLGAALSHRHRLPLVVEYNGSEVWVARHWGRAMKFQRLAQRAEEAMLRHAHLVVTVSEVLRDELIERGIEPARIVTYPNGIDPVVFDPTRFDRACSDELRRRHGIAGDALVVTFVGTFGQWHGAQKLAQAIAQLQTHDRVWLDTHKVRFVFVGDGLTRPQAAQIIAAAGAEDVCTFAGLVPQPEAPLYLAASDVLVSPHVPNADGSRFFGSPTKLFEYMAMGKAIVASDLEQIGAVLAPGLRLSPCGHAPALAQGARALLVEPGRVDELVAGLRLLIERADLRDALGRHAREAALAHFTWDTHVQKILDGLNAQLNR